MNNGLILGIDVSLIKPEHYHTNIPIYGYFIFDLIPRLSDVDQTSRAVKSCGFPGPTQNPLQL
jgi:hypothetical protein